jgi:hypothetical protein
MHEKGIEIFLVNTGITEDADFWRFPDSKTAEDQLSQHQDWIQLDPVKMPDGHTYQAIAVEGDWHDIPSIREIIKYDMENVKTKIKDTIPELEKGSFFALKEAFKRVLPEEYKMLKELKDVLLEKNLVKYM